MIHCIKGLFGENRALISHKTNIILELSVTPKYVNAVLIPIRILDKNFKYITFCSYTNNKINNYVFMSDYHDD